MARKGKIGIDYFSHDVDILQDKKIKLIKAKHGLIGYAVYLRLLEEIYRDTGYYLQLDENFNILFSDDNKIALDVYILILNDCINIGLFNQELYKLYSVITSKRIQLNYFSGTERRKEVEFIKEYLLSDPSLNYNTEKVNVNIISLNVDIKSLNDDIGTQKKGKEKKEEEKKEDKKRFKKPTIEEIKNYCIERKNNIDPEAFYHFYESKNWKVGQNKMKNWKSAMITWEKKDKPKQQTSTFIPCDLPEL